MANSSPTKTSQPKEFLVVSLPDEVQKGSQLRLLAITKTLNEANKEVSNLDATTLGKVAVLERKVVYNRRQAVENVEFAEPMSK